MDELEKRMIALEERFSYQDDLVSKLNIIVANQELLITNMVSQIKELREQNSTNSQGRGGSPEDDVPPHY